MTMRNQIKNAVADYYYFFWQVPSILEDSTKDDGSSSDEEEEDDEEEKSEGEETQEVGNLSEEAQLDRKVPTGNRKCRTDELSSVVKNKLVFLSFRKERNWLKKLRGRKEKLKFQSI